MHLGHCEQHSDGVALYVAGLRVLQESAQEYGGSSVFRSLKNLTLAAVVAASVYSPIGAMCKEDSCLPTPLPAFAVGGFCF